MRSYMMKKYGLTDSEFADISKNAVNMMGTESNYGKGVSFYVRSLIPPEERQKLRNMLYKKKAGLSHGLSQLKISPNEDSNGLKEDYRVFNVNDETLERRPDLQGQATVLKIYDNRQRYPGKYRFSNGRVMTSGEKDSIIWNRGKITDKINTAPEDLSIRDRISNTAGQHADSFNRYRIIE